MENNEKLIQDWQQKVRTQFGESQSLYTYLFQTMDNFYYRYLETAESKDLKTEQLKDHTWGALSFEVSMVDALKTKIPEAKKGIMELAKTVPKAARPMVRYGLWTEVKELTAERGHLKIVGEINWNFPDFQDPSKRLMKVVEFKYQELAQFRKELALRLEEACEIF